MGDNTNAISPQFPSKIAIFLKKHYLCSITSKRRKIWQRLSLADIKSSTFGKASARFYLYFSSVLVISMHRNKYLYYLADKASTSFDKNELGQSTKGTYILQELNGGVFWFQICEYTSTKLVLKNKLGQTLIFKKQ